MHTWNGDTCMKCGSDYRGLDGDAILNCSADNKTGHAPNCEIGKGVWSGSINPDNPDNSWICDECGGVISAN